MSSRAPDPAGTSDAGLAGPGRSKHKRRVTAWIVTAIVAALAVHIGYPAIAGLRRSVDLIGQANLWWIAAAFGFSALSLGCYVAVFHQVVGAGTARVRLGWREHYDIAMSSQAASTVVTAAGAGGIALMFWALTRAGFDRAAATARIVAFLTLHYVIYLGALVVLGFLLGLGILPGSAPVSLTLVPAALAAAAIIVAALIAASPARFEPRIATPSARPGRLPRVARHLVAVPAALAAGIGYATGLLRPRSRGLTITALALGYWASNIAILGACFEAFGERPAAAGLVQAFFIGMTVNVLPLLPGGVGSVEAGLIAALLAFGQPGAEVVVSVLAYRLIGFWLPTIPESVAYLHLRRTVERWPEVESASESPATADSLA